jgi:hypothetical protein
MQSEVPTVTPTIKPGWRTTEFWLILLVNVLPEIGAIDVGGTKVKAYLHAITLFGYALSRGIAKATGSEVNAGSVQDLSR